MAFENQERGTIHYTEFNGLKYKTSKYICKFCKVEVYSKTDTHAVMGHEHKKSCPRRRKF